MWWCGGVVGRWLALAEWLVVGWRMVCLVVNRRNDNQYPMCIFKVQIILVCEILYNFIYMQSLKK